MENKTRRQKPKPRIQLSTLVGEEVYYADQIIDWIGGFSLFYLDDIDVRKRIREFVRERGYDIDAEKYKGKIKFPNGHRAPEAPQYFLPKSKLDELLSHAKIPVTADNLINHGSRYFW